MSSILACFPVASSCDYYVGGKRHEWAKQTTLATTLPVIIVHVRLLNSEAEKLLLCGRTPTSARDISLPGGLVIYDHELYNHPWVVEKVSGNPQPPTFEKPIPCQPDLQRPSAEATEKTGLSIGSGYHGTTSRPMTPIQGSRRSPGSPGTDMQGRTNTNFVKGGNFRNNV